MSGTPESTLAAPDQLSPICSASLPSVRPSLISGPPNSMHSGANLSIRQSNRPRSGRGRGTFDTLPMSAVFYHPNGRACITVSATHSIFFHQYWHPGEEVYRGPDGHYYRINDNRPVD